MNKAIHFIAVLAIAAMLNGCSPPMAKPTSKSNQVVSPYEPYHIIDVTGFGPGQLARDPSNRKIFRIP